MVLKGMKVGIAFVLLVVGTVALLVLKNNEGIQLGDLRGIEADLSATRTLGNLEDSLEINFSRCTEDRMRVDVAMGSTTLAVEGIKGSVCRIYYGGEVENPNWDGKLTSVCEVPTTKGKMTFPKGGFGVDLSSIGEYCSTR